MTTPPRGMAPDPQPQAAPSRRRPRPRFYQVTVAETVRLTPRMIRVYFSGAELSDYQTDGPGSHCKLLLPGPGSDTVAVPELTADGPRVPDGHSPPVVRTYTPRLIDRDAARVAIDFALHDDPGPASAWAARAEPGAPAVITAGRGAFSIEAAVGRVLLVADETALPAVATILQSAPAGAPVTVLAEITDAAEELHLESEAEVSVRWLHRAGSAAPAGSLAVQALATQQPGADVSWVGLEASAMRAARKTLLGDWGLPRTAVHTRGYWKYGAANHPDHDTGEND